MRFKVILICVIVTLCGIHATRVKSKSTKKKVSGDEPDVQKLLKTIRKLAKEAGHPNPSKIGVNREEDADICYTEPCLESAIEILEAINFDADPCDQKGFAKYSCHRRLHRKPEDKYQSPYGNQSLVGWITSVKNANRATEILEDPIHPNDPRALKNAKVDYKQCLRRGDLEKQATKSLWELSLKYGGWPALTQKEPTDFKWYRLAAFLARFKSQTLLFDVAPVHTQNNGTQFSLDKGSIVSSQRSFFRKGNDGPEAAYNSTLQLIRQHWEDFGADSDLPESFDTAIAETMKVRDQLSRFALSLNTKHKTPMTIAKLNTFTFSTINWLEFFEIALASTHVDGGITEDTIVHVNKPYIKMLTAMWHDAGMWEASLLQFELFKTLMSHTSILGPSKFAALFGGMKGLCSALSKVYFGGALSKEFLRKYPSPNGAAEDIEDMRDNVISSLKDDIKNSKVLYSDAKKILVSKFDKVETFLGYPEWLDDKQKFRHYYAKMKPLVDEDSKFLTNQIEILAWVEGIDREGLQPEVDNLLYWPLNAFIVEAGGASYLPLTNALRIPAPFSAPPIYRYGAPGFMNYGGLGTVLGHELGHGMDPSGILFDTNGLHSKHGVLSDDSAEEYNEWVINIVMDYNNTKIHYHGPKKNMSLNLVGSATIKDDFADIIGLQVAFQAYKKYVASLPEKEDKRLPGLDHLSGEKLFYVRYSNMWCEEISESEAKYLWARSHSPGYVRATLPLKRSQQFAETFECKHTNIYELSESII